VDRSLVVCGWNKGTLALFHPWVYVLFFFSVTMLCVLYVYTGTSLCVCVSNQYGNVAFSLQDK